MTHRHERAPHPVEYARIEQAHAKLNLVLRILAREASGYHGIETLFQRLALHDVVRVCANNGPSSLHCDGPTMPPDGLGAVASNLAWRAAVAYAHANPWLRSWQIDIEKHIPVGGGLGGGSADAAAVLRALDALAPEPLGLARLLDIGGTLGADVPFLVSGDSLAWAWGRGDRLLALPPLPTMAVTLVAFDEGVHTGQAYGAFADARAAKADALLATRYAASAFASWDAVTGVAANDFEPVVSRMHQGVAAVLPLLREAADVLRLQQLPAVGMMSGSGATCFVLHPVGTALSLSVPDGARIVATSTH